MLGAPEVDAVLQVGKLKRKKEKEKKFPGLKAEKEIFYLWNAIAEKNLYNDF